MWFIYIHIFKCTSIWSLGAHTHTPGKHNQIIEVQYNDVDMQCANVANLLNEVALLCSPNAVAFISNYNNYAGAAEEI